MKNSQSSFQKRFQHIFDQEIDPAFAKRSEYILSHIWEKQPENILDAGCGRGYYVKLMSLFDFPKKIVGVDINEEYLKTARSITKNDKRVSIVKASLYKLPFKDNSFDAIICSEILEHLDDEAAALQEIQRVLKPSGTFLVSVPHHNFPFLWDPLNWLLMRLLKTHVPKHIWWLAGMWADHERLYTSKQLQNTLEKNAFKVTHQKNFITWSWPLMHFFLYGIGKNIVVRLGASSFDRFNVDSRKPLSRLLAWIVRMPSMLFDKAIPMKHSVSLVARAVKKSQ